MKNLDKLESQAVFILREAYANFKNMALLWSIGKDSTVLLWLCRKAFFGHVPFPLIHVDTMFKFPEMIEYRDRIAMQWKINLIIGKNEDALNSKQTFPDGAIDRLSCCKALKTIGLRQTLDGKGPRYYLDLKTGKFEPSLDKTPFTAVILGVRADEEGSRSKERYFSPRDKRNEWNVGDQPPELWNQFKTDFAPGTHIRIHPLLDWTEVDIWEYVKQENIPMIPLYFDQGKGERYRSVGCYPCTFGVASKAKNLDDIITELNTGQFKNIAERSGRAQDQEDGGLESLRRDGYM